MDELLRARQFAAQRERRLAEAVRAGHEPDHAPMYGRPPRQPDPELMRQLAQAQNLREGLGARCLELSDRLLAAEDRQLAGRLADGAPPSPAPAHAPAPAPAPATTANGTPGHLPADPWSHRSTGPTARPAPPQRAFPTGARFGGGPHTEPAGAPDGTTGDTIDPAPATDPPPLRGARFRISRTRRAARKNDDRTTSAGAPPGTGEPDPIDRPGGPVAGTNEPVGTSWARTPLPGKGFDDHRTQSAASAQTWRPRTGRDHGTDTRTGTGTGTVAGSGSPTGDRDTGNRNTGFEGSGAPGGSGAAGGGTAAPPTTGGARPRTGAELITLVQRITDLHRQGAVHESAAVVGQVALVIAPADLVGLATLLRSEGPTGSSTYLARSVALGAPEHAAATLAELRREGLVEEAADLFHALWTVSAQAFPALLAALEQSGQSADGQTLLWERASAPANELSELTRNLRASGRSGDARHLLRQAAGRPVGEVAAIAAALGEESATELVGELVRMRSADDVGQFAAAVRDSVELYNAVLFAADGLEEGRARSAFAALRTAGLPTEPALRPRSKSRQRR
ncbi:hypothetical protein [Kitasatospora sp. NPDC004272]